MKPTHVESPLQVMSITTGLYRELMLTQTATAKNTKHNFHTFTHETVVISKLTVNVDFFNSALGHHPHPYAQKNPVKCVTQQKLTKALCNNKHTITMV